MAYKVLPDGSIETDSLEEAIALSQYMRTGGTVAAVRPVVASAKRTPAKAAGVQKSWDEARKLAKKEGISVQEARAKLAKAKS